MHMFGHFKVIPEMGQAHQPLAPIFILSRKPIFQRPNRPRHLGTFSSIPSPLKRGRPRPCLVTNVLPGFRPHQPRPTVLDFGPECYELPGQKQCFVLLVFLTIQIKFRKNGVHQPGHHPRCRPITLQGFQSIPYSLITLSLSDIPLRRLCIMVQTIQIRECQFIIRTQKSSIRTVCQKERVVTDKPPYNPTGTFRRCRKHTIVINPYLRPPSQDKSEDQQCTAHARGYDGK